MPQSNKIGISHDVTFDETFFTAVATTWKLFQDFISLCPSQSLNHTEDDILEHTGSAEDFVSLSEKGNNTISIDENNTDLKGETSELIDHNHLDPETLELTETHSSDDDSIPDINTLGYTTPIDKESQTINKVLKSKEEHKKDSILQPIRVSKRSRP